MRKLEEHIFQTIKNWFNLTKMGWFGSMKMKHRMNPDNPCDPHYELVVRGVEGGLTIKILLIKRKYKDRVPAEKWDMLELYLITFENTPYAIINENGRYYFCVKFRSGITESEFNLKVDTLKVLWHSTMNDLGFIS